MNIKVEIQRNPAIRGYEVWVTQESDGRVFLAKPFDLTFQELREQDKAEPTMSFQGRIADEFLQAFAEGLAKSGYKIDALKNTSDQISAIKYHLEDMRKLVFKERK